MITTSTRPTPSVCGSCSNCGAPLSPQRGEVAGGLCVRCWNAAENDECGICARDLDCCRC